MAVSDVPPFPKRRWRVLGGLLAGAICVGMLASAVQNRLGEPANGDVRAGQSVALDDPFASAREAKRYQGEMFSFDYPAGFILQERPLLETGPVKAAVFLTESAVTGEKIAVTAEHREPPVLEASPSYQFRLQDGYQQEPAELGGRSGALFTKQESGFEQTFFFLEQGHVLAVSATSPVGEQNLRRRLESVMADFEVRSAAEWGK